MDEEIVVTGFNLELSKYDIKRLQGSNWLNDEVINFYMELLKARCASHPERYPKCYFFNTFFYALLTKTGYDYARVRKWTNKVNLFEMQKVFVPLHEHSNHWTMAVINIKDKRFEYYDSFQSRNMECLRVRLHIHPLTHTHSLPHPPTLLLLVFFFFL